MTAMNLVVQQRARAAFLLTDTASIGTQSGRVTAFLSKVIPVPIDGRVVAAVAASGRLEPRDLADQMDRLHPSSLAEFLAGFPEAFLATESALQARNAAGSMSAVVAAFDHRRNLPLGYGIANDNALFPPSHRPYALGPLSQHITEFDPDDLALREIDFRDPRQWSPERDAEQLIEAERRDPDLRWGHYSIGGQAVLTRVDASGVTSRVVKRWPDLLGRLIEPGARARLPGWRDWLDWTGNLLLRAA